MVANMTTCKTDFVALDQGVTDSRIKQTTTSKNEGSYNCSTHCSGGSSPLYVLVILNRLPSPGPPSVVLLC